MATWSFALLPGGDITNLVDIPSIRRTRRLHTELKPNVNTLEFRCLMNANALQSLMLHDVVSITVLKDSQPYFAGVLSPNYQAQVRDGQRYLTIIAEDYTIQKLGQTITTYQAWAQPAICNPGNPTGSMVHIIAAATGITVAPGAPVILAQIPYLVVSPDDKTTWAKLLESILFEYGYVYYFDAQGRLCVVRAINAGAVVTTKTLTTAQSGANIRGELNIEKSPERYDDIRITYDLVELKQGLVLFQDTSGSTAALPCNVSLAAANDVGGGDYYPKGAKDGEVYSNWKNPEGYEIYIATEAVLDATYESGITVLRPLANHYTKASFALRNTAAAIKKITKLRITGSAYVVSSKNTARTSIASAKTILEHEAKYIFDDLSAKTLANLIAQYYKYSDIKITLNSTEVLDVGDYVQVQDPVYSGIAVAARVVEVIDTPSTPGGVLRYALEAVADFSTITITTEGQAIPAPPSTTRAVTLYIRSATTPPQPTGDNPAGWSIQPPAENPDVPMFFVIGELDGSNRLIGSWSPPVRFTSASPVMGMLSNEEHAVPCDMNGNNCNFFGAESRLYIFEGAQETTAQFLLGYEASSGVTVDAAYFNAQKIVRITAMSEDVAFVDLIGMRSGITVRRRFGIHKARQGDPAPVYQLQADKLLIPVKPDGKMTQKVRFDATYRTGLSEPQPYAGILKFYINDLKQFETPNPQAEYTFEGFSEIIINETDITLTDQDIILPFEYQYQPGNEAQTMRVELWNAENSVRLDSQSVVFMADYETYIPAITEGAPRYLGKYLNTSQPTKYAPGQAWLLYGTSDQPNRRGVWLWDGTQFVRLEGDGTEAQNFYFAEALPDILWAIKNGYGLSANYGHVVFLENLVAGIIATNKLIVGANNLDQTVIDASGILATAIKVRSAQITGKLTVDQIDVNTLFGKDAEFKGKVISDDGRVAVFQAPGFPSGWANGLFISTGNLRAPVQYDTLIVFGRSGVGRYRYMDGAWESLTWFNCGDTDRLMSFFDDTRALNLRATYKRASDPSLIQPMVDRVEIEMPHATTQLWLGSGPGVGELVSRAYIDKVFAVEVRLLPGGKLYGGEITGNIYGYVTPSRFYIPNSAGGNTELMFHNDTKRLVFWNGSAWENVNTGM